MIVVSDASPLISLAAIGQLDLLRELYAEVVIPVAVHREITHRKSWLSGQRSAEGAGVGRCG